MLSDSQVKKKDYGFRYRLTRVADISYIFLTRVFVLFFCLIIIFPLLHVLASSISDPRAIAKGQVHIWPVGLSTIGYSKVFEMSSIWRGYANSFKYVFMELSISMFLIICAAYPLSRREFKGRKAITVLLTISMLFNGGIIPLYMVVQRLGMLNTSWALILPYAWGAFSTTGGAGFNIFMLRNYISGNIAEELYEAGKMDGCTHWRYLFWVILPLSKPILAVLVLLISVGQWNAYFPALMFLSDNKKSPLQLVLVNLLVYYNYGEAALQDPLQYASKKEMSYLLQYSLTIVSSLPMLILYPLIQKHFVKGIMIGAIKG